MVDGKIHDGIFLRPAGGTGDEDDRAQPQEFFHGYPLRNFGLECERTEEVRFELTRTFRPYRFSRAAPSATRPLLHTSNSVEKYYQIWEESTTRLRPDSLAT